MVAERFPIEEGHIASFARSIGDANSLFYGPEAVAPPTFVQASAQFDPDYFLRPKIGQPWFGSGKERHGDQARRVGRRSAAVVAAAGCTPSSTTSTTARCGSATC